MSRERFRKALLPPGAENVKKLKNIVKEGNYYVAQQMYKTTSARYATVGRFYEALDLLQSGACLQLEHEQVTCGGELAIMFVEMLVKAKVDFDDDYLGISRSSGAEVTQLELKMKKTGRWCIPQPTETHLPRLVDNESIVLYVIDLDGVDSWGFKFRYWANNQSRMYVFEGTGPFTKKHGLETGDYMLMYRDLETWDYVIRAVKAYEVEGFVNKEVTTTAETKAESVLPNDATFDLVDYSPNLPIAESVLPNDAAFDLEMGMLHFRVPPVKTSY